jgi:hypothetical protein
VARVEAHFRTRRLPPAVGMAAPVPRSQFASTLRAAARALTSKSKAHRIPTSIFAMATAAEQVDYMKRVRYNGGARSHLRAEGIIILGQYRNHAAVARALGLPVPGPGESVSARIAPAHGPGPGVAEIDGGLWRLAGPSDPRTGAPLLPET